MRQLANNSIFPVSKIYKFSTHELIQGREYAIYEYLEGKTLGQAINEGYLLEESFVREEPKKKVPTEQAKVPWYKRKITLKIERIK